MKRDDATRAVEDFKSLEGDPVAISEDFTKPKPTIREKPIQWESSSRKDSH